MQLSIFTRSFQSQAGISVEFDQQEYIRRVRDPIGRILSSSIFRTLVVITNGDSKSKYSEKLTRGHTLTGGELASDFYPEVELGRLKIDLCEDWGSNPGSARALTQALKKHQDELTDWVMIWSPEIEVKESKIVQAIEFAEKNGLTAVGFLRKRWWERTQWNTVQNTASLWRVNSSAPLGWFDTRCDTGEPTLILEDCGEVPAAGMEDFHLLLRCLKTDPGFRWGMFGISEPVEWNVDFKSGSEREKNHRTKVLRQLAVMKLYCKELFPDRSAEETLDELFIRYFSG